MNSFKTAILPVLLAISAVVACQPSSGDKDGAQSVEYSFTAASAEFDGEPEGCSFSQYSVTLKGSDAEAVILFNTSSGDASQIPTSTYTAAAESNLRAGTFTKGSITRDGVSGSYITVSNGDILPISDGSIEVSYKGSTVMVEGRVSVYGLEYKLSYSGGMSIAQYLRNVTFSAADCSYYGDYYGVSKDDYFFTFYNGETDEDGYFIAPYESLSLDILAPVSSTMSIPVGTFSCSAKGRYESGKFLPSEPYTLRELMEMYEDAGYTVDWSEYTSQELDEIAGCDGSYYSEAMTEDADEMIFVMGGSVTISKSGSSYTMSAVLSNENGKTMRFSYSGPISLTDESDDDEGDSGDDDDDVDIPSNVVLSQLEDPYAVYYGDLYDCGANLWYIDIISDEICDDMFVDLEILTSSTDKNSLPTGTFNISSSYGAGTALAGGIDEDDYIIGCWLGVGDYGYYAATSGKVTISKSGSSYTISFDLKDDDEGVTFKGSYTGSVTFEDGTANVRRRSPSTRPSVVAQLRAPHRAIR